VLVFPLPSAFSHSVGAVGPAWLCFVFFVFSFFASDMVGGSFWGERRTEFNEVDFISWFSFNLEYFLV